MHFLQTLMDSAAVGALYALIALGYTMVYGILRFINFAHSDVFVLGAWISLSAALCAGFEDLDKAAPGVQYAAIAPWVIYAAAALAAVAALAATYERIALPRARSRRLPRSDLSGSLILIAVWAWSIIGLVHAARAVKSSSSPALDPAAGVLILLIAMATCGLVGFVIERFAYKPLRNAPRINVLIAAIGVSLLLQNAGALDWMFGTRTQNMPTLIKDRVLNRTILASGPLDFTPERRGVIAGAGVTVLPDRERLTTLEVQTPGGEVAVVTVKAPKKEKDTDPEPGPRDYAAGEVIPLAAPIPEGDFAQYRVVRAPAVPIRLVDVLGVLTAVVLMLILDWLVFRTRIGRAMRAVSYNTTNAALMGIDVNRVVSTTFVIGAALAAAAGFLHGQKYSGVNQPAYYTWTLLGLKAFVAAVVGGIGNIRGAMLGGFMIAFLELFVAAYISPSLRDFYVFALLIVVLLVKPTGILGSPVREKV